MWPWGHLAVGYLLYSLFVRLADRRVPGEYETIALAFGTQFPDLVDKPLAWTFGVLPNGRSLTHSLLIAAIVVTVVGAWLRKRERGSIATAFGVGYLSHLLADALGPVLSGDYYSLGFLGWPLVPAIEYSTEPSFTVHLRELTLTTAVAFEFALGFLVFLLWLSDGLPGLAVVRGFPNWVARRLST